MNSTIMPRVAVLLPTYNGANYIKEQITSILSNTDVACHIFAHDDGSTDDTLAILKSFGDAITILAAPPQGGAAQNVFFLMCNALWMDYDFVSLADQDDIWHPEKLSTAVAYIKNHTLDCYSSDVTAFWPDRKTAYVRKSQDLRTYDYFFEGGAPGNTHLYTRQTAVFIKEHLKALDSKIKSKIKFHDWFFYALCRSHNLQWGIHAYSGLQYRQHNANVIGSANGLSAIKYRLKRLFGTEYFDQVSLIANAVNRKNPIMAAHKSIPTKLRTVWTNRRELRRKKSEGMLLAFVLLLRAFK